MTACPRETCFAPDIACDLGHMDLAQCPCWTVREGAPAEEGGTATDGIVLPWPGSTLGLVDLGFVAGGAKPLVVGIAGPQAAGKTTLLAAWYLLIGRGLATMGGRRFAGSYSLAGWEAIAGSLRWRPGQAAGFPPHTTSRGGRVPGLLHLMFREADGRLRGYLLADAPGEWFQKWAVNRDAAEGEGARWVADHADVFLLVADREALSGPGRGAARGAFQNLVRRLGAERWGRPVALVWTKADVEIAPEMEKAVRDAVAAAIPDATEFFVSIVSGKEGPSDAERGLVELLDWTLSVRRACVALPPPPVDGSDPLFVVGAR